MGFYLRQSVSLGPLRLNLSKSGIGASVGVKGLRIGMGPSGTYVHAGLGGLYYRSSLHEPRSATQTPSGSPAPASRLQKELELAQPSNWQEIDSGNADLMVDSTAETVIQQLKRRHDGTYWFPAIGIGGLATTLSAANQGNLFANIIVWTTSTMLWAVLTATLLAATLAGAIWGFRKDSITRGGVAFLYDLEPEIAQAFEKVYIALDRLGGASLRYHVHSTARLEASKTKYHGGANTLIKTTNLHIDLGAPKRVSANVPIPSIPAGNERLCFFPERLIVLQGSGRGETVGAIPYKDLRLDIQNTTFTLQSASAPSGTELVGHTWQYVNKNGGPDRRFKDNKQLAVIATENLTFKSQSGLNEGVMHSTRGIGHELATALEELASLLARSSITQKVSAPRAAAEAPAA